MPDNTGIKILSILMATTPERESMFRKLYLNLSDQVRRTNKIHPTLGEVEIIIDASKRFLDGGLSIGDKRQALLERATAKYLCYLDSDEDISPDYVETLLRLCYKSPDVCTFRSIAKLSNNWALIDMRLLNGNEQINPETITLRNPWHVCPVKREYAQLYKFTDSNYGEDWVWFEKVLRHCESDAHTDKIIHSYCHGAHSEADKI